MAMIPGQRRFVAKMVGIILVLAVLAAGIVACEDWPSQNLEIRDWYDLDAVRENLTGNHRLMNDLDAATAGYEELAGPAANGGKGWRPIGHCEGGSTYLFVGRVDGQGYEIRDLFINRPDESCVGVFGTLGNLYRAEKGIIENVGVANATVTGGRFVGGLVGHSLGYTSSTVSNCYVTGSVAGNSSVGGLVGLNHGTVGGCYYMGNVTGITKVGGLIGSNRDTVSNSYSAGSVIGNSDVGGLLGYSPFGPVSNCYSTGNVSGHEHVGGLVGNNGDTVSNSYSAGSVIGNSDVGGLLGYNHYGTVSNCYSTGNVSGHEHVGGLIGSNDVSKVRDSFWDTETSGQSMSDGGTGKNTTEMQDIATFSGANWNIMTVADPGARNAAYIWNIVNGVTYPFLSWEPVA
jgi:hypothetical protein